MTTHARRFGQFHHYNQQQPSSSFSPNEVDELIAATITPELSSPTSDKSGESYAQPITSDESGETQGNCYSERNKFSTEIVEKPVEKRRFEVTSF
jgi:hypothetical protein